MHNVTIGALTAIVPSCSFLIAASIRRRSFCTTIGAMGMECNTYCISHEPLRLEEQVGLILCYIFCISQTQAFSLLCAVVFLFAASYCDMEAHEISDAFLVPCFLFLFGIGLKTRHPAYITTIAIIFILYLSLPQTDSELMGGADIVVILGLFAALGVVRGIFSLLMACIIAVSTKMSRWLLGFDKWSDRGIVFVPALTGGFLLSFVLPRQLELI